MARTTPKISLFAPEVIQTSSMDCGPASLKCLLEGSGIPVSYGRLREACQTDVDGTSIDTLEEIAQQLGLDAEQEMLPVDHLLLSEAEALPALVVTLLPNGFTHFVVVWRRHGPFVQLMDPGSGRRWIRYDRFMKELYIHEFPLPAADWHAWARSDGFLRPLRRRLHDLGVGPSQSKLLDTAVTSDQWRSLAALDASTRLTASLVRAGGIRRGLEAQRLLTSLAEEAMTDSPEAQTLIPDAYWSARAAPAEEEPQTEDASRTEMIILRGAVCVCVRGHRPAERSHAAESDMETESGGPEENAEADERSDTTPPPLSPELARALNEPPSRPGHELFRLLRGDGVLSFSVLFCGIAISAASLILEAVILRGAIDVGRQLGLVTQRLQAVGYFLIFAVAVLLVELPVAGALLRLGRRLETRLRLAFLEKIPRLLDRYFQSRPVSDMAERSHSVQRLREVPRLGGQLARAVLGLLATACAVVWIFPAGALLAILAAILALLLPLAFKPRLEELDLRARTHSGALSRFYLDALLGLATVRAHAAERSVRREHESLLVEWASAGMRVIRTAVTLDGLQALSGFGLAAALMLLYAARAGEPVGALLLAYWTLMLPVLGEEIALLVRQYPTHRNLALRLLEPLGAPEDATGTEQKADAQEKPLSTDARGVDIAIESVTVIAAGHTILQDVDIRVEPGSHVAVVGASGAGKSSLAGLLLGWHRAAQGRVLVDGEHLDTERLDTLRAQTVWIDPAVQLWNRSLLANLRYGAQNGTPISVDRVLRDAELYGIVERLPDGLQTALGEGGGLVSGGEGQRVRLGRGLSRSDARLVILDEPFRGLDREMRKALLDRVRHRWSKATLFCITHDVLETRGFSRVLVIDAGRVVEDGAPEVLAAESQSQYRALLDAEDKVRSEVWSSSNWRRMRLESGRLHERREEAPC